MDYVVGSIAALISGNVTPNRPKLIRRALTPTKHPASPNVTPKSEFVEDRSIFLSPTQQKKKAIVKKSPKRIFENPDLDITENNDSLSPKADKVKKHLKDELEANEMGKSSILSKKSPSDKLEMVVQSVSPNKKSKNNEPQVTNENTPKKKKRKSELEVIDDTKTEEMEVDQDTAVVSSKSTKKMQRRKSVVDIDNSPDILTDETNEAANKLDPANSQSEISQDGKKKKNKKRKKNKQAKSGTVENQNRDKENKLTTEGTIAGDNNTTDAKSPNKKKRKNKNKKAKLEVKETQFKDKIELDETEATSIEAEKTEQSSNKNDENDDESDEEISNIANPNAITEKDTDSEHDSDDEIDSENEDQEVLKPENAEESSDDESKVKTKKGAKQKKNKAAQKTDADDSKDDAVEREDDAEVIKRTLFVGNVPFSGKCKKDIKRIFSPYGEIQTVRIRTVPVKDGRVTPKLAVIKNEIHPDRSTVNVYVKFADADSVERALAENNTVLNHHHLRVSRSSSTGVEHDPDSAVFVGNLPFAIEDETLREKFEKCGLIQSVRIVRDKKTNAGKGFGYVNFASKDGVELALQLSEEDLTIKNRIIRVKRCTNTSKGNKSAKQTPRKDFGNRPGQNRNFGNNQGQTRNFGNNQRNYGGNQNRSNQGPRSFGNSQGQNRNVGNNQGQNRNFGNNQGQNRNYNSNQGPRSFGNKFGHQGNEANGASRRIMNKRPNQESVDGPPTKKQHLNQPAAAAPRDKKQKKEFVGMTAEKKKKQKFNKGQKKKKAISEIMTK